MSFAFPDIDPNRSGAIHSVPVPLSRYLDESFDFGEHSTILNSLNRMSEMSVADDDLDSPILDSETANKKWAVGNLKFDEPVRESVARVMNRRKRDEMDRDFFLSQGASAGRFIPGMAATILGAVSNPLDLGIMFVPFVGEEAVAAKATTVAGRLLARRLITRETLRSVVPQAPRLTESIINGMVGQTVFEIPNLVASAQDQSNYGPQIAAFNIATAGGFSASLHGAVMVFQKLGRGTRETMAKEALNQWIRDETVQVHKYVAVDEGAIWAKIENDFAIELKDRISNLDLADVKKTVLAEFKETVVRAAVKMTDGEVRPAGDHMPTAHAGIDVSDVAGSPTAPAKPKNIYEEGWITDKGRFVSREEAGELMGMKEQWNHLLQEESPKMFSEQLRDSSDPDYLGHNERRMFDDLKELGDTDAQAMAKIADYREANRERFLQERPEVQAKIAEEQQIAISRFMDSEKAKFEQQKQTMFDAMKQQEIERQIAEGRTMTPEEIQKNTPPAKFEDMTEGQLSEDIAGLKKMPEAKNLDPQIKANIEAIDAAVDCILKII